MAITACTLLNLSAFVCFLKLFYVNFVNYSVYRWNSASVPAGGKCSCCLGDIGVGGCQPASWYYPKKGRKMSWFCVLRNLKFRVIHLHIFVWELELKLFGFFFLLIAYYFPIVIVSCSVHGMFIITGIQSIWKCQVGTGVADVPVVLSTQLLLGWWSSAYWGLNLMFISSSVVMTKVRLYPFCICLCLPYSIACWLLTWAEVRMIWGGEKMGNGLDHKFHKFITVFTPCRSL